MGKEINKKTKKTKINSIDKDLLKNKNYKNAEKLYKDKEYDKAFTIYKTLTIKFSECKKVYKRLIDCYTHDFQYREQNKAFNDQLVDLIAKYKVMISKKELKLLNEKLENYKKILPSDKKSRFLLIALFGFTGIHKFLDKQYLVGILYLLTFGLFGLGVLYDLVTDYCNFEDNIQFDIFRYLISFIIIIIAILFKNKVNYYYLIIIGILFMPIIYSKLFKLIPNLIKVISIIILVYFTFRVTPIIEYTPNELIGNWKTENENTNIKELKIGLEHSTITFDDIKSQKGNNDYNKKNKVLTINVNNQTYYKFKLDKDKKNMCLYNESDLCVISFTK